MAKQWLEVRIFEATPGMTPIRLGKLLMPNGLTGKARAEFLDAIKDAYEDKAGLMTIDLLVEDICPKCRRQMIHEQLTDRIDTYTCNHKDCENGDLVQRDVRLLMPKHMRKDITVGELWENMRAAWRAEK